MLKHLYEISVSECQRIATTKLFYLTSFDAPVRSLLSVCLLQPLEQLCNNICPENLGEFLGHACGISLAMGDFVSSFYIEELRKLDTDALDFLKYLVTSVKMLQKSLILHKAQKNYDCIISLKLVWHIISPILVQKSGMQENFQLMVR